MATNAGCHVGCGVGDAHGRHARSSAGHALPAPLPPVTRLLHWHGRMWGRWASTLIYSAIAGGMPALHLYHPVGGCLSMDAPVTMILPTLDGLYIGTTMSAWFLSGDAPDAPMRRIRVDGDGVLGAQMLPPARSSAISLT